MFKDDIETLEYMIAVFKICINGAMSTHTPGGYEVAMRYTDCVELLKEIIEEKENK
jgi:hypothetical protein